MPKQAYRYKAMARVRLDFIWSVDGIIYETVEEARKDAIRGIREDYLNGGEVKEENLKISNLKVENLGPYIEG